MAKMMVSIPDDPLERADTHARELATEARQGRAAIEELLGDPVPLGGDAVKLIRHGRCSRTQPSE